VIESSIFTLLLRRVALGGATLLLAVALPSGVRADNPEAKQFSVRVSENLGKLQPLANAKDWDGVIKLIDETLAIATPGGSYEQCILNMLKGNFLVQKEDYVGAIEPMETALRITDQHDYLGQKEVDTLLQYLMQIYYTEASAKNRSVVEQQLYLGKAIAYLKRHIEHGKKPTAEEFSLYSTLLYNQAMANSEKPDKALIGEAQKAAERALLMTINPKEQAYAVLLATLQHQGNYARMAEILELLVERFPKTKSWWEQLFPIYYTLATDDRYKRDSAMYYTRAILTVERAQRQGFLNSPKDYFKLVTIYFTIGQFERACELLESGLKNGTIEPTWANWNLLSYSYQQVNKEFKAIEVLKQASAYFPHSGEPEFSAAIIYSSMDKIEDSYRMAKAAARKGVPGKDWQIWNQISWTAYQLGKYDEALQAA